MYERIVPYLIGAGILFLQYYLSRREKAYWGGILPLFYVGLVLYGGITDYLSFKGAPFTFYLAIFGGLILLLSYWDNGRKSMKKKRKKELEKIELQNLI